MLYLRPLKNWADDIVLADINDLVVLLDDFKGDRAQNRVINSKRQWLLYRLII